MQTNNLMSNIMIDGTKNVPLEIGMGATVCGYSDRHAGTVIMIKEEKGVTYFSVQLDHAKRTDDWGMSDMQEYEYSPNPDGPVYNYRIRKGKIEGTRFNPETKRWVKCDHGHLILGVRKEFYDFTF